MIYQRTENLPIRARMNEETNAGRINVTEEQQPVRVLHGYYYLTRKARSELPAYQYSGKDYSLVYRYILSPQASFLVEHVTPQWLAPNAISLLGLSLMGLSYSFMWYYCPNLDEGLQREGVPRWIFLFNFFAMLAYQTLDNADGKQARRTKSSSPLGLLFDHGCDALNSLPGSVNWAIACGLGFSNDPIQAWFVISCAMTLFYVTTWEEYYTNELILPVINGPSEGLIAGASFSLISFLWGVPYWHETTWFDRFIRPYSSRFLPALAIPNDRVRNVDVIFYVCVVWLIQEEALKIYKVGRKYGAAAYETLFPYLLLMVASTHIGLNHPEFLARNTRVCLNLVSALFAEMAIQLMLDHMCKERYNPYRFTLLPLCLLVIMLQFSSLDGSMVDDYVFMYCVAAWTFLLMKVRMIIKEMCSLLGIWCFDIVTPYPIDKVNVIS